VRWLTDSLTALALPPVLALELMGAALVLLRLGRHRGAAAILAVALAILYLPSTTPVRDALLAPLERQHTLPPPEQTACDAIVVAGAGVAAPAPPGSGAPPVLSPVSAERVLTAFGLWRRLRVPLLLSGGGEFAEAPAMAEVLAGLGVPDSALVLEWWSTTTYESARHSQAAADAFGWRTLCLVTSAWHMPRAARVFRQAGLRVVPVPAALADRSPGTGWLAWVPRADVLHASTLALREYLALAWYRLRYGA
jgi:uncharacterized SAM-binding protein YcdF (DUF218 family)